MTVGTAVAREAAMVAAEATVTKEADMAEATKAVVEAMEAEDAQVDTVVVDTGVAAEEAEVVVAAVTEVSIK